MESIKELNQLLSEAREQEDERLLANVAFKLGDRYLERGKFEQALPLLEESLDLCRKLENPSGEAVVSLSLSALSLHTKDPDKAEALAQKGLAFYKKEKDQKGLVKSTLLLGDAFWEKGEPDQALSPYGEALETCRSHGDVLGTATFLDRIATMHRLMEKDEEALLLFRESLECWQKLAVPDREAVTLTNMGDINRKKGDAEKAIAFHEQAIDLYRKIGNVRAVSVLEKELEDLRKDVKKEKNR